MEKFYHFTLMNNFLKLMAYGPRKIAVTGHFGCGKTEFAVSLAFALAKENIANLALADLDVENPYFRSRERMDELQQVGVSVYSDPFKGKNGSELQTLDPAIRAPLENPESRVILDAGGDFTGAMILNQYSKFLKEDTQLLFVLNQNRPGTDTMEKAIEQLHSIENTTGLSVTGIISNTHFIRYTTAEDVLEGWEYALELSRLTGIPALCACCMESLVPEVEGKGFDVFPIGMHMRESYLDKIV